MASIALSILAFLFAAPSGALAETPRWGSLEAGRFAIGFRSEWRLDHGRTYRTTDQLGSLYGAAKSPRPVLLNIWYPARAGTGTAMAHGDYFNVPTTPREVAALSAALSRYARDIAAGEARDKQPAEFDAADRAAIDALFATAIPARRNAAATRGRFPLIIYHAGFGSSFEDNAVLCEYLASHGFVVVSSAYLAGDGDSFNIDGREDSIADMRTIALAARSWPNADWSRIGLVGHSGGAQAALKYQAAGSSLADAIVSLDTTQDPHSLVTPAWSMTGIVLDNLPRFTAPILFAADRTAIFQLADRMTEAERYLVTAPHLDHNDYISQGVIGKEARAAAAGATSEITEDAGTVRGEYDRLARTVLAFLDAHLRDGELARAALRAGRDVNAQLLPIEYLPRLATGTAALAQGATDPPSARQLRLVGAERGFVEVTNLLSRFGAQRAALAIYEPFYAAVWLSELAAQNRPDDLRRLFEAYRSVDAQLARDIQASLMRWANLFTQIKPEAALSFLRAVVALDPANADAAAKLEALTRRLSERR